MTLKTRDLIELLRSVMEPGGLPDESHVKALSPEDQKAVAQWAFGARLEGELGVFDKPVGPAPKALRDLLPEENFYKNWRLA